jgi:hypothetical protein
MAGHQQHRWNHERRRAFFEAITLIEDPSCRVTTTFANHLNKALRRAVGRHSEPAVETGSRQR